MTLQPEPEQHYLITESEMQQIKDSLWMLKGTKYQEHMRQGLICLSHASTRQTPAPQQFVCGDDCNGECSGEVTGKPFCPQSDVVCVNHLIEECNCPYAILCSECPAMKQPPRPHPAPAPTVNRDDSGNLTLTYNEYSLAAHDAAIARQAREDLLDVIEEWRCTQDLTKGVIAFEIALGKKIESLRQAQPQERDQQ